MDSNQSSMWSNIVKNDPPPKSSPSDGAPAAILGMVGNCRSTKGISTAVVDANAVIEGGQSLTNLADKLVTVPEVLSEIRDPASRRLLDLSFIETMKPSPESLSKVIKFAGATGDLQTLSLVDLKLIALTYSLEAEVHGTKNLRDVPPPIQTVSVKRLSDKKLSGWGSNVCHTDYQKEDEQEGERKHRRYPPKKTEIKLEGKMVVEGVDASQGQYDEDNSGDWRPAVSSNTRRRFLRRKARWERYNALAEQEIQPDQAADKAGNMIVNTTDLQKQWNQISKDANGSCGKDSGNSDEDPSSILKDIIRLKEVSLKAFQEGPEETNVEATLINGEDDIDHHEGIDGSNQVLEENIEIADDGSSEQSWSSGAFSESSVACITGDYAMQNVILQMGLCLLAPRGMQIRQLNRWIWKCHACYTVTPEIRKRHACYTVTPDIRDMFCPKCGNGGTLHKVAVTIDENGTTIAARKPRITLRGTKFSIPMPKGGRDAITKNLVLREDQLPRKFLHPQTKKKARKPGDGYFVSEDVFLNHHSDKKAPLQPPVRKTMAVFRQKRNPNDNHYFLSMH